MKLLREIYESELGIRSPKEAEFAYKLRKAARAVVFNREGKIAVLYVSRHRYHKLPGGGIKSGESVPEALKREVREETGAGITVRPRPLGLSIEYRDRFKQLQISYAFLADLAGEPESPAFTSREKADGFELKWLPLDEAIETLKSDAPDNYVGKFIRARDLIFLQQAGSRLS